MESTVTTTAVVPDSTKIQCMICNADIHSVKLHIEKVHAGEGWTVEKYKETYPEAPLLSEMAIKVMEVKRLEKVAAAAVASVSPASSISHKALHELFGFDASLKSVMNGRGDPVPISVLNNPLDPEMIPDGDSNHVYEVESLKNILMGIELNMPVYVYGHAGTGKTTLIEQVCSRTRRPMLRVQHTANTEESHILGQWTAIGGETKFELGPLAVAMVRGWVYLADEYDFAQPSVLAVYQPVLEGKSLVIKEADAHNRIIKPHPDFRFIATGNTNGSGDESGLYQGTAIQNAANYDRFNMCIQMFYMKPELEARILMNQAGITEIDAKKIVDFANRVREQYEGSKISNTISPRTLIAMAKLGIRRGSYRIGLQCAFTSKLTRIDREVVEGLAQRIFG